MNNPCVNLKIVLDKRRQKKDKTYPVKIRVIYRQEPRVYNTGVSLTEDQFTKVMGQRPHGENRSIREYLEAQLAEAKEKCLHLESFSFDAFTNIMRHEPVKKKKKLFRVYDEYLIMLKRERRVGTYLSYRDSLASIRKFCLKEPDFSNITPGWLKRYEAWMLSHGKSSTTIGMYTRALRAVYNYAVEQGYAESKRYPFGKNGYVPPTGKNIKKALTIEQVRVIAEYNCRDYLECMYRDFWLLSYLCNGANIADLLRLKGDNIQEGCIVFHRQKTRRTRAGKHKPVVVPISDRVESIMNEYGNMDDDGLIFPYLKSSKDEFHQRKITNEFIKQINKHVGCIAKKAGLQVKVTSYTARHSWATIMERNGAPVGLIRDGLGHTSTQTTEKYLAGFDRKALREYAKKLL